MATLNGPGDFYNPAEEAPARPSHDLMGNIKELAAFEQKLWDAVKAAKDEAQSLGIAATDIGEFIDSSSDNISGLVFNAKRGLTSDLESEGVFRDLSDFYTVQVVA